MNDSLVLLLVAAAALWLWRSRSSDAGTGTAKDGTQAERPNISIGRVGSDYILEPGLAGLNASGSRTGGVGAAAGADAVGGSLRYTGPENNPRTANQPA